MQMPASPSERRFFSRLPEALGAPHRANERLAVLESRVLHLMKRLKPHMIVVDEVRKWINIGVVDDGRLLTSETGTGQGQIISKLLANLYLHHVLDMWFEKEVKPRLRGQAYKIRYADDALLCFQFKEDAERVLEVLPKRFAKYGLTLHPEKTRLVKFGRSAHYQAKREKTKAATFDFLGFTHRCATGRSGKFALHLGTMKTRLRRGLIAISAWCRVHMHAPLDRQQRTLNAKLRGHYQYYGRPTNFRCLAKFAQAVRHIWRRWLARRTRGQGLSWQRFDRILARYPLLRPRITHAWASK